MKNVDVISVDKTSENLVSRQEVNEAPRNQVAIEQVDKSISSLHQKVEALTDTINQLECAVSTYEYKRSNFWSKANFSVLLKLFSPLNALRLSREKKLVLESKFFDLEYYCKQAKLFLSEDDAIHHYLTQGAAAGLKPSESFDTEYYVENNPDVRENKVNPLVHYIRHGRSEGRYPSALVRDMEIIRERFDTKHYLETYPDVRFSGLDPVYHYCVTGWKEGRNPSPVFDTAKYLRYNSVDQRRYLNPFVDALCGQKLSGTEAKQLEGDLIVDVHEDSVIPMLKNEHQIKPIAFYLPQFHEVQENNDWWGEGFTDWTSCKRATKMFTGHWQSRKPHPDIGYYDLTDKAALKKQAALAKRHGLYGFCFYYYNFSGARLLEKPLELLFENKDIDTNYCVCWANENWSRRWDGSEDEVLMEQKYLDSDDENTIADIARLFSDSRYIRFEGKPVVLIYRKAHLKDPLKTTQVWREWCRKNGHGEIHLVCVQTYQDYSNPTEFGFDAASEMPAHLHHPSINKNYYPKGLPDGFSGNIHSYSNYANGVIRMRKEQKHDYQLYRTVSLKFDNTGRKPQAPHIFTHFNPDVFQSWLMDSFEHARKELPKKSRFVFINAWNEWAEGTYLEPDMRYGYTALNALSRALNGTCPPVFRKKERGELAPKGVLFLDSEFDKTDTMASSNVSVGIHVHAYYKDLLDPILKRLKHVANKFDLFVTTPSEDIVKYVQKKAQKLSNMNELHVARCENKGRDIAPLLVEFGSKLLQYDVMLHLHTKKSDDQWFTYLLDRTIGDEKTISRIINELHNDESVGLVYPQTYPRWSFHEDFGGNEAYIKDVCQLLKLECPEKSSLHFPAGSFYWAKPKAIRKLLEYDWSYDQFPAEPINDDGTIAHGIERLMCHIAKVQGFSSVITASQLDPIALPAQQGGDFRVLEKETWYDGFINVFKKFVEKDNVENVIFDIFDTLVVRPFKDPEDLFTYMEPLLLPYLGEKTKLFKTTRINADGVCRRALPVNTDVTIDAIYEQVASELAISIETANKIKQLEIDLEIKLMQARPAGVEMLKFARKSGARVFLASDMYLRTPSIKAILDATGITEVGFDHLLVSSEIGKRKDTTKLYKHLIKKHNVSPAKSLVVGDNLHSDVTVPMSLGFKALHLPKAIDMLKRALVSQGHSVASLKNDKISQLGVIASTIYGAEDSRNVSLLNRKPFNLGYIYLGPLLYEFSRQLIADAKANGIEKLHFLTREGIVLKKVYDIVAATDKNAPKSVLCYSSRTIANSLGAISYSDLKKIINDNMYMNGKLAPLFRGRFGYELTEGDWEELNANGITDAIYHLPNDKKVLYESVKLLSKNILPLMKENAQRFTEYLESELCERSALVDIGYSGTMQASIQKIVSYPVKGYYLMAFPHRNKDLDKVSFLHNNLNDSKKLSDLFFRHSFCYEAVMMPPVPSVVGVAKKEDTFTPIYGGDEVPQEEVVCREEILAGTTAFASDVVNQFEVLPEFDFEGTLWGLKELIEYPEIRDNVAALADVGIEDNYTGKPHIKLVAKNATESFLPEVSKVLYG